MRAYALSLACLFAVFSSLAIGCGGATPGAVGPIAKDVNCTRTSETAYTRGVASRIEVVKVGNDEVAIATAHAFLLLREAAAADGVPLVLNSGFRTMKEQQYLYGCYQNKSCNNGNLAAKPGFSNHQNGIALDIKDPSAKWLYAHAKSYGFENTVPSEPWHWEYAGADPGGMCSE